MPPLLTRVLDTALYSDDLQRAKRFYTVIAIATMLGLALNLARLSAIKMLFWAAVVNGMLAPPLILLIVMLTNDGHVMGQRVNPPLLRYAGWITLAVMTAAAVGMLVT